MKQYDLLVAIVSYLPQSGHIRMVLQAGKDTLLSFIDHTNGLATHSMHITRLIHLDHDFILIPFSWSHPRSVHFMIFPLTLGNSGRCVRRTGAQIVFARCQPVNNGGTPRDYRFISTLA